MGCGWSLPRDTCFTLICLYLELEWNQTWFSTVFPVIFEIIHLPKKAPLVSVSISSLLCLEFFFFVPKQSLKTLCFQAPLIIEFSSLPPVSFPRVSRVAALLRGKVHKILLRFSFCLLTPTYRNPCHFAVQLGSSYAIINFFPWPYLSETHASLFPTEVRIH